ncbi:MAG: hypothetical protein EPN49_16250 [Rhodanobacter sp.]|nr:MAG: hypothetical protein EPN49_16250 [Rhodanobacter sp.]
MFNAWDLVLGVVVVIELTAPLVRSGVPAFRQDWFWPTDTHAALAQIMLTARAWDNLGTGYLQVYPTILPLYGAVWLLTWIASVNVALIAVCGGAAALTLLGIRKAIRELRGDLRVASCGLIVAPFFFTEEVAGHYPYLVALAGFAWCIALLLEQDSRRPAIWRTLAMSLVLYTAFVQIQVGLIAVVFTVLLVTVRPTKSRIQALAGGLLLCLVLEGPTVVGVLSAGVSGILEFKHVLIGWELSQSLPFRQTVAGTGYIGGYPDRIPFATPIGILMASFGMVGLFTRRTRESIALAIAWIAAVLVVNGLYGPLGPIISWAFRRVPFAAAFRELYSLEVVAILALSIGLGLALSIIRNDTIKTFVALLLAVITLCQGLSEARLARDLIPFWHKPSALTDAERVLAAAPGSGRVLVWPFDGPIGDGLQRWGKDPASLPIGSHGLVNGEVASSATLSAVSYLRNSDGQDAARALANIGVQYVLIRGGWRSATRDAIEPALVGLVPVNLGLVPKALRKRQYFARLYQYKGITVLRNRLYRGLIVQPAGNIGAVTKPILPLIVASNDRDPRGIWVSARDWYWLDPSDTATGALTLSRAGIELRQRSFVTSNARALSWSAPGSKTLILHRIEPRKAYLLPAGTSVAPVAGATSVSSRLGRELLSDATRAAHLDKGSIELCSSVAVLADQSRAWRLRRRGGAMPPDGVAFGYAAAWSYKGPCTEGEVYYAGQASRIVMSFVSLGLAAAIGLSLLLNTFVNARANR